MKPELLDARKHPELSPRETQLVDFAASGLTDTAIAQRLGISEATVSTYWGRVRIKLGPFSRTELVSIVLRERQEAAVRALRDENEALIRSLRESMASAEHQGHLADEILDNAPDAIVLVASTGIIIRANNAAKELFGYTGDEMTGMALVNLMPERFRELHHVHRNEYVQDPSRRAMGSHMDTPALRATGEEFLIRASLSALATADGLLITCVIREVVGSAESSQSLTSVG